MCPEGTILLVIQNKVMDMYPYGKGTFCEVDPPLRLKGTAPRFFLILYMANGNMRIFLDSDSRAVGQKQRY